MSRITNDTEAINRVLSNGLIQFATNIMLLGGILVAMFLLNWQLAIGDADPAAVDGADHWPGDPPQPRRIPGCAVQPGRIKRRHGGEHFRDSSGTGVRPGKGHRSTISSRKCQEQGVRH